MTKKITALLLALVLAFGIAACGQKTSDTGTASQTEPGTSTQPAQTPPGDTAQSGVKPEQSPGPQSGQTSPALPLDAAVTFAADYAEVFATLTAVRSNGYYANGGWAVEDAVAEEASTSANASSTAEAPSSSDGSKGGDNTGTNVQVAGIDEGDIVKTDGEYLYVLTREGMLAIVRVEGESMNVMSRLYLRQEEFPDYDEDGYVKTYYYHTVYPSEMFLCGKTLIVLSSEWIEQSSDDGWTSEQTCRVDLYDVSDPASPRKTAALGQEGGYRTARLTDGRLYVISTFWVYNYDEDDPGTFIPYLEENGVRTLTEADHICICNSGEQYTVVTLYDVASGTRTESYSLLGGGDTFYMSENSLYVMGSDWKEETGEPYADSVYTVTECVSGSVTDVYRFDLSNTLTLAASGSVPGYLESQFSADEYEGYVRLVTTRNESRYTRYVDEERGFTNTVWGDSRTSNSLYVLDGDLNVAGSIEDLAEDERVYSARFDGPIGYFCTFRNMDPLFAVDVSDPTNPKVLSALKISGFSEYLHAWSGDRLFGLGREADEENGWAEELKLVMFDTSDKTDVTVRWTQKADSDYSEALYDHKAIFIQPDMGLIGFFAEGDYCLYSYSEDAGFTLVLQQSVDSVWWGGTRAFMIGGWFYIVSGETVAAIDVSSWSLAGTVYVAEGDV